MSRSLGLREDQRLGEVLVILIAGLFAERSKDRSLRQLLQVYVNSRRRCRRLRSFKKQSKT
jgi:hypothetical protein